MPIISSMGALSTRGLGQFRITVPKAVPGAVGVFYRSGAGNGTNKYTFADKTMAVGTNLSSVLSTGGAAVGNSTFMVGWASAATAIQKYIWATNTTAAGPSMPSNSLNGGGASSNSTQAMFQRGNLARLTYLYEYGPDTVVSGAQSRVGRFCIAAGNSEQAIFRFGNVAAICDRYTYASALWSAASSLTADSTRGAACGIAEYGIFAPGLTSTVTNKYVYATDVVTVSTALTVILDYGAAIGNNTSGLFAMGAVAPAGLDTSEFVWAGEVVSVGTSLAGSNTNMLGSGSGTTGVNA